MNNPAFVIGLAILVSLLAVPIFLYFRNRWLNMVNSIEEAIKLCDADPNMDPQKKEELRALLQKVKRKTKSLKIGYREKEKCANEDGSRW